ncbi:glycosyltransferase [Oceanobacillus sp. HCA-5259]|uniref:glycosyltransferase n=1 Tax=Oceanobacillus sp. HCA-5259 TaxID=3134661 RepID=UPI0030C5B7DB
MYVLTIGRSYPSKATGMMGIFELEQARALSNNGCEVTYVFCDTRSIKSLRKYGNFRGKTDDVNIYGQHLPIGGLTQNIFEKIKSRYLKKVINKAISNHGFPDVIHVHFPLLTLTEEIWKFLRSFNRPIVVTEHWTKVQTKSLEPFRISFLNKVVDEANEFICVGEPLKKSVFELTHTEKHIRVIPNMVSPLFYFQQATGNNEKSNQFEFITVGRLVEVKRFNVVVEAFSKAFSNNKNVHLTIVGGGPLYDKLNQQVQNLDMKDQISLLGFLSREETAKKVRKSDAFVSASVLETFGVPFIEAMASGKPVIGAVGGAIDTYIDESNGLLFQADNVDDLSKSLKFMVDNRMNYNERQIAEKADHLFSENAVAKNLIDTFNQLIKK